VRSQVLPRGHLLPPLPFQGPTEAERLRALSDQSKALEDRVEQVPVVRWVEEEVSSSVLPFAKDIQVFFFWTSAWGIPFPSHSGGRCQMVAQPLPDQARGDFCVRLQCPSL
jgi:hypothetical protein